MPSPDPGRRRRARSLRVEREKELDHEPFDLSRELADRRRGERPGSYEYATEETLVPDPLPRWRHLPIAEVRRSLNNVNNVHGT